MTLQDAILRDLEYSKREKEREAILKALERESIKRLWRLRLRRFRDKAFNSLIWMAIVFAALYYFDKW